MYGLNNVGEGGDEVEIREEKLRKELEGRWREESGGDLKRNKGERVGEEGIEV